MKDAELLLSELDQWQSEGRVAQVWWRDDDAQNPSSALQRLVDLSVRHQAPLSVAAVPAALDEDGLTAMLDHPLVTVLQHGFSHENQAAPGGRAVECGGHRPIPATLQSLLEGKRRLEEVFGSKFQPIMVPPWNRIERSVAEALPPLGYHAISVFGLRHQSAAEIGASLPHLNAHLDLLTWKGGARFAGHDKSIRVAAKRLAAIREARTGEPFGILTHHLDHNMATWAFLEELLTLFGSHPAIEWCKASDLLARADTGTSR